MVVRSRVHCKTTCHAGAGPCECDGLDFASGVSSSSARDVPDGRVCISPPSLYTPSLYCLSILILSGLGRYLPLVARRVQRGHDFSPLLARCCVMESQLGFELGSMLPLH
jgi:hypothetical protein